MTYRYFKILFIDNTPRRQLEAPKKAPKCKNADPAALLAAIALYRAADGHDADA